MGVPILTASTPQYQPLREGELVPDSPERHHYLDGRYGPAAAPARIRHRPAVLSQRNVNPDHPGDGMWHQASWAYVLRPVGGEATQLIVRWRNSLVSAHPALDPVVLFAIGVVDAVMHRKQLRGIKQRAQNRALLAEA